MKGICTFRTVEAARAAGFEYDDQWRERESGNLVYRFRRRGPFGLEFALVVPNHLDSKI